MNPELNLSERILFINFISLSYWIFLPVMTLSNRRNILFEKSLVVVLLIYFMQIPRLMGMANTKNTTLAKPSYPKDVTTDGN